MLREEGFDLTLAARRAEKVEAAAAEIGAVAVAADVSDADDCARLVAEHRERFGRLDGFVDTPMAQWSGIEPGEMIRPEDCAEIVRMALRLSPYARIPQVVIERMGSTNGDVPG
jgi:NADP-dependent 3-hydroxy acid dehydrogenase YdfG